jgi:cytohesin
MILLLPLIIAGSLNGCGTDVHSAAWKGDFDTVKEWVEKGGDVNAPQASSGGNILSYAAGGGNVDLVKYLLSKGAKVNDQDKDSTTPLHYAAREHHPEVIKALVEAGAQPNVFAGRYKRGHTEAHTAAMHFPYEGTPLHWGICGRGKEKGSREATVKTLLELGSDPNAKSQQVAPPLKYAVAVEEPGIVRLLLEAKADPNNGAPLHIAVACDNYDIVKLLMDHGADVNRPAQHISSFDPLNQVAGQVVTLGTQAVTPLSLAKSDRVKELLQKAGAKTTGP